jgi:hypothetical protein
MNELRGMGIFTEPKVLHGKQIVYFLGYKNPHKFKIAFVTYGDCCSETWIEHLEMPNNIIGATILDIENIDLPEKEKTIPAEGVHKFYRTIIKTDKGDIDIEYRNESNGYYGGSLDLHIKEADQLDRIFIEELSRDD